MFQHIVDFVSFGEPFAENWYELIGKLAVAGAAVAAFGFALALAVA